MYRGEFGAINTSKHIKKGPSSEVVLYISKYHHHTIIALIILQYISDVARGVWSY